MTVRLIPLEGLPEVRPGDDLAWLLEPSLTANAVGDGDVVAVTQKVVSKAEGRIVSSDDRTGWVERESVGVVARRGDLVITKTRHGLVCANAGVDASNVGAGFLTLLPEDPDGSAERLQKELCSRLGLSRLGVVITDTFGRPWREGVVDVAIGCAGLPPLLDLRGRPDDHGRVLESTVVALADAVAAASGLVMTKTGRVPAALVRGLDGAIGDAPPGPARALIRSPEDDLFPASPLHSISTAASSGRFGQGEVPVTSLEDAVAACTAVPGGPWLFVTAESRAARGRLLRAAGPSDPALDAAPVLIVPCRRGSGDDAGWWRAAGAGIRSLVLALHARRLAWTWDPFARWDEDAVRDVLDLQAWRPLGIVGAGPVPEDEASRPRRPATATAVLDRRA